MLGRIVSNKKIAYNVFDMVIDSQMSIPQPGQFIHISVGDGTILRRPISICDYQDKSVRIVFAIKGNGTKWLADQKQGDTVDFLAPLGHGFPTNDVPTLLVGGGIGVPPMLFCSKNYTDTKAILGFRNSSLVCLHDEFDNVELFTDDGSAGVKGYPHLAIEKHFDKYKRVFTCGALPMMKAVAKVCQQHNIECYVSMEERMGCGVGACLVCACATKGNDGSIKYKHVCKDGPVFLSSEVQFDD